MIKTKELIGDYLEILDKYSLNKILDLGCGNGRLSLRFAKNGLPVVGVDKIDRKLSCENFKFIQEDIRNFQFSEKYSLIISSFILHFFKKDKAMEIIERMKNSTESKGFNFLICIDNEDNFSKEKPENFYPNREVLERIYSDWEIIKSDNNFTEIEEHDNLGPHRHHLIFFIARKR